MRFHPKRVEFETIRRSVLPFAPDLMISTSFWRSTTDARQNHQQTVGPLLRHAECGFCGFVKGGAGGNSDLNGRARTRIMRDGRGELRFAPLPFSFSIRFANPKIWKISFPVIDALFLGCHFINYATRHVHDRPARRSQGG